MKLKFTVKRSIRKRTPHWNVKYLNLSLSKVFNLVKSHRIVSIGLFESLLDDESYDSEVLASLKLYACWK
jgi:hypothetical protein